MAKFVNIILFLLLAVALHGIANNISNENVEQNEYAGTISLVHQDQIGAPQLPYLPVAELTSNLQSHQISMSRVQRVQTGEYFFLLKNFLQNWAKRESSLSLHREKIYATTVSCYCQPACEYYVFALKHIII
ncbi:hypothetical protein [Bacteroides sp.]|uniref:hypothetical protein n=1 Tax=Bacteroides sp. TaxID=29523 RepID=UPI0026320668|nr:hypothetical protein [Bacteroides sp.]MDD3040588.1 hypothetical protein [Bacteroides sp.]